MTLLHFTWLCLLSNLYYYRPKSYFRFGAFLALVGSLGCLLLPQSHIYYTMSVCVNFTGLVIINTIWKVNFVIHPHREHAYATVSHIKNMYTFMGVILGCGILAYQHIQYMYYIQIGNNFVIFLWALFGKFYFAEPLLQIPTHTKLYFQALAILAILTIIYLYNTYIPLPIVILTSILGIYSITRLLMYHIPENAYQTCLYYLLFRVIWINTYWSHSYWLTDPQKCVIYGPRISYVVYFLGGRLLHYGIRNGAFYVHFQYYYNNKTPLLWGNLWYVLGAIPLLCLSLKWVEGSVYYLLGVVILGGILKSGIDIGYNLTTMDVYKLFTTNTQAYQLQRGVYYTALIESQLLSVILTRVFNIADTNTCNYQNYALFIIYTNMLIPMALGWLTLWYVSKQKS